MTLEEMRRATKNMRNRTAILERSGDCWKKKEREQLEEMFCEGVGISEIAVIMQRSELAITQQFEAMDLYRRRDYPRRSKTKVRLSCLCKHCRPDYELCELRNTGSCVCGEAEEKSNV